MGDELLILRCRLKKKPHSHDFYTFNLNMGYITTSESNGVNKFSQIAELTAGYYHCVWIREKPMHIELYIKCPIYQTQAFGE